MTEVATVGSHPESDRNKLSFDDAWLVAHDPAVKRGIDEASAGRRVAKKLVGAIEQGHSAVPEIQEKARLAQLALRDDNDFYRPYDILERMADKATAFTESLVPRWKLRDDKKFQMHIDEANVASKASYGGVYHDYRRATMTPGEIRNAEIALADEVLQIANKAEGEIEDRTRDILATKEPSNEALAQLASVKERLTGKPAEALSTGTLWDVYRHDTVTPPELADTILRTVESDPVLRELVVKGMERQDKK